MNGQPAPIRIDPSLFRPEAVSPETAAFNAGLESLMRDEPPVESVPPEESRKIREQGTRRTGPVTLSDIALERRISGPAGDIPVRVFLPPEVRGIYLHLHGGGWVLGRAHLQDPYLERIARDGRCAVVSVDYRLAPENPYPAGPDDCETAASWLLARGRMEFGVDRFVIGGESAGACLAASVLLRLAGKRGRTSFAGANLVYGIYDLAETPSLRTWGRRRLVLNTPAMRWFIRNYAPAKIRGEPDVSPLQARYEDLAAMPKALFTVGTLDPLLDDSLFMAARWTAAGAPAELEIYPGGPHGFATMDHPLADRAVGRMTGFLRECFSPR